jgi:tRNA A-37 threonylcarbamoyl transferase component Bud32
MSRFEYCEKSISEMSRLLDGIATSAISLNGSDADERYQKLRRRLSDLAPFLGPLPPFLRECATGWAFWEHISFQHKTYQARRTFLAREFDAHYAPQLRNVGAVTADVVLLQRDLVLKEVIGSGGYGTVHRAEHITLGEERAVKVYDPSFFRGDDVTMRRFAREAAMLSQLNHRHIVRFYDAGIAGSQPFIVTELAGGKDLQAVVAGSGVLPEAVVRGIVATTLDALGYAHAMNVVHRDVKPSNLIWDGSVLKVVDFGAGIVIEKAATSRLTTHALGTPGYIAPELLDDPTISEPSIDIFSVGATAHYLLTARLPFPGNVSHFLEQYSVSPSLIAVIARALSPPETRYRHAEEFRAAVLLSSESKPT